MGMIFSTKKSDEEYEKKRAKIFSTKSAPKAVGPYSLSMRTGDTLFCSGQIGVDPDTMKLVKGGTIEELKQICNNIHAVVGESGLKMKDIVKTTIFLQNMDDYAAVNEVYAEYFEHKPARSAVAVAALPLGANIEIEVIASFGSKK